MNKNITLISKDSNKGKEKNEKNFIINVHKNSLYYDYNVHNNAHLYCEK